ncbi:MAG: hypothetical protein GW947_00365 [Candidatus Pacebacteria bacterium]|nr:hypothetical protein [Candidatus Paceibacterota bacterium]PIR61199.1 MAG: hypothetical protein COU68_00670 [Candidatus Pacebacteria bacterium CG10_big_fil_rev_8_21_14_0_10_45_6]
MANPDQLPGTHKTIYEASFGEIFVRNFVAGMARTLGGLFLYIVVLFFLGNLFLQQVWPVLQPQLESLRASTQMLQELGELTQPR